MAYIHELRLFGSHFDDLSLAEWFEFNISYAMARLSETADVTKTTLIRYRRDLKGVVTPSDDDCIEANTD